MPAHAAPPPAVLVVDDVRDTADSTAIILAAHGFRARAAYGGDEALAAATADPPDLVLFDVRMPGMDGWELARRLRAGAGAKRPLLVAVTAAASPADQRAGDEAGADLHLVKPVEPGVLVGVIRRFERVISVGAPAGDQPPPSTPLRPGFVTLDV